MESALGSDASLILIRSSVAKKINVAIRFTKEVKKKLLLSTRFTNSAFLGCDLRYYVRAWYLIYLALQRLEGRCYSSRGASPLVVRRLAQ